MEPCGNINQIYFDDNPLLLAVTEKKINQHISNKDRLKSYIIGGGEAAEIFIRNPISSQYRILGIFDDDPKLQGNSIQGIPVLGAINKLNHFIQNNYVKNIIYLIPSIQIEKYIDLFQDIQNEYPEIEWLSSPPLNDISLGLKSLFELTNLNLIPVNQTSSHLHISEDQKQKALGKVTFITGGAGSIGSKVVEQLFLYNIFTTLVVIDTSELNAYKLSQAFPLQVAQKKLIIHLTDYGDVDEINSLLVKYQPAFIYHAGAYKHVNLLENDNVLSAIKNNVVKSINLFRAILEHSFVKTFILVSSDKAVNPLSVMGYTKRLVEISLLSLSKKSQLDMIIVRFGNVVGSSGSVFHKFLKQIQGRQKITLTDINVTRYFMNISQAASLIIKASLIGEGNRVYVLKMGEAVKIYDFLIEMIKKYGELEQKDSIIITGLKSGEKLTEELHYHHENIKPLDSDIFVSDFLISEIDINKLLKKFSKLSVTHDEKLLKSWLQKSISDYGDEK